MSAVLGGTQSLHTNALDEAIAFRSASTGLVANGGGVGNGEGGLPVPLGSQTDGIIRAKKSVQRSQSLTMRKL